VANIPKVWNGTAFIELEAAATVGPAASTTVVGMVQLSDSTSTTSSVLAATPTAVKSAYDLAAAAIPKTLTTTTGDIIYASSANTPARLGIGTASQVLSVSGGVPAWTTPAGGGGMTLIATATPSAATSLSFTSISGSYKHLFLIWRDVYQSARDQGWAVRLNNDSGSAYKFHLIGFDGSNVSPHYNLQDRTEFGVLNPYSVIPSTGTANNQYVSYGEFWVYRYTESESKLMMSRASGESSATRSRIDIEGVYSGTAAITSIDFIRSSTQTITGTFYLYGVS
jgi:hypothetical protein